METKAVKKYIIQWHITERCNLRCKHCYQENYSEDLSIDKLYLIFEKCKEFILGLKEDNKIRFHINFTGGEPFIREEFIDFLYQIKSNYSNFTFGILSNGTLITPEIIKALKDLEISFLQVSIDGDRTIHDKIRGAGNFNLVIKKIKQLKRANIRTYISFTANKINYKSFPVVSKIARKLKVDKLWADRYVPLGDEEESEDLLLGSEEYFEFMTLMNQERERRSFFRKTNIVMDRALQFQLTKALPYACNAGRQLLVISANGDLLPCRRLPIKVDNLLSKSLVDIYYNSELLKKLRDDSLVIKGCEECSYNIFCRGGAKCMTYALTGQLFASDPGCKIANALSNS